MQYHRIPCNTIEYHAIPSNTIRYHHNPVCYPRCYIHLRWRFLYLYLYSNHSTVLIFRTKICACARFLPFASLGWSPCGWVGGFNKFEMFEPVRGFLVGGMPRRSILKWPWLNDLETGKWLAEAESRVDRLQICVQPRIGRIWPCSQIEIQSVEQIVFEHCNETSPSEACVSVA